MTELFETVSIETTLLTFSCYEDFSGSIFFSVFKNESAHLLLTKAHFVFYRDRHHHYTILLQLSASSEVLPPWKQGGYVSEAVSGMMSVSSSTQLHMEKHWEQQVSTTREVSMPCRGSFRWLRRGLVAH